MLRASPRTTRGCMDDLCFRKVRIKDIIRIKLWFSKQIFDLRKPRNLVGLACPFS